MTESRIDPRDRRVVEETYVPLRRFAAVVAPDGVEGDDLLQEALVQTLQKRRLHELEYPAAYLRRTMINLASNHRRRAGSRQRALTRLAAEASADRDTYPSDLAELMALPPRAKAVLFLAEVDGYPYAEISRMIGCSEAAARKSASRARRRLRTSIALERGR
jgi:RNA polymerase sigma factor (sigma-70 family)